MNYNKIKLYWKTCVLKRGYRISLCLTYACNLRCSYCSMLMPSGKPPQATPATLEKTLEFIQNFPVPIREVYLSGGEPTLSPNFVPIATWLLDHGYHVLVFTNLSRPEVLMQIPKNYRFSICATYHHDYPATSFLQAYNIVYKRHRIDTHELGPSNYNKKFPWSKVMPFVTEKDFGYINFLVSPDLQIFIGCWDHYLKMSV